MAGQENFATRFVAATAAESGFVSFMFISQSGSQIQFNFFLDIELCFKSAYHRFVTRHKEKLCSYRPLFFSMTTSVQLIIMVGTS